MISTQINNKWRQLTGRWQVPGLLLFALLCHGIHFLRSPFPVRDPLLYLHILHYWNTTGSYTQVLEKFPKFGLMLFSFLPLKWAEQLGIPLYPASVVWVIAMSLVSVYAFYRIVWLLTDDRPMALWCGALFATHPMLLVYAGHLFRDTPYLMFTLLCVLLLIHAIRSCKWYFFLLVGVLLAMCVLSRLESWELLVLCPLFAIFYMVKNHSGKRVIGHFILLAAAGFLGTILLCLCALDDLTPFFAQISQSIAFYIPDWMGV